MEWNGFISILPVYYCTHGTCCNKRVTLKSVLLSRVAFRYNFKADVHMVPQPSSGGGRRSCTKAAHGSDQSRNWKPTNSICGSIWERSCLECQLGPWAQGNKNCASLKHERSEVGGAARYSLFGFCCGWFAGKSNLCFTLCRHLLCISPRGLVVVMKGQEQNPYRPGLGAINAILG